MSINPIPTGGEGFESLKYNTYATTKHEIVTHTTNYTLINKTIFKITIILINVATAFVFNLLY